MEVLAPILILELSLALRHTVKQDVSRDGDVPENEDVRANQDDPMQDELALLLGGDLGF